MKPTAASSLAAGLLLLLRLPYGAIASPSVNVALQASFDAGPYLVELLYATPLLVPTRVYSF